jgi:hypothetical protein
MLRDIFVNLFAVFLIFIARLLGFDLFSRAIRLLRRLPMLIRKLSRVETALMYTDCEDELHTTRSLAARLEATLNASGHRVRMEIVRDGVDLARWPFPFWAVSAIVLLLTDVTQFSPRPRDRARLQNRLVKYVHNGGCLVLGHDVIYRRTRNERLQRLAGCVLDNFKRLEEPVKYEKVTSGARACSDLRLLASLPSSLELGDNEVIIGTWMADVEYLYHWQTDEEVPLVTRRTVGQGRVYWMNSGDTNISGPPRSLARPEDEFVSLLAKLLQHR